MTEFPKTAPRVLSDVLDERVRQVKKWGPQSHDDGYWALILGEEYGEVCQAAMDKPVQELRDELIQVAAVAVAWVEDLDAKNPQGASPHELREWEEWKTRTFLNMPHIPSQTEPTR